MHLASRKPQAHDVQGVSQASTEDRKKALVRGLSGLLRVSPVSADVDPKNFFMLVNSNYAILVNEDRLDLGPLWDALAARAGQEDLTALFLKFEEKSRQLGFQVVLPPAVDSLDAGARAASLEHFERTQGGTPLPQLEPVFQQTGDLHRRVLRSVVHGFRASPVGQKIDSSQLNYFIGERLPELFDGKTFDAQPVVEALREQGIEDPDIYVGVALAQERLATLDVVLPEPVLNVSQDLKADLLRRAQSQDVPAAPPPPREREKPAKTEEHRKTKAEQLRSMGLGGTKKGNSRVLRLSIMGVLLAGAVVASYLSRPNRSLTVSPYEGTLPLKSAQLVDGAFVGTLDVSAWDELTPEERRDRLDSFSDVVRGRGLGQDLQVRAPTGELLIVSTEKGIRAPPRFIEHGSAAVLQN